MLGKAIVTLTVIVTMVLNVERTTVSMIFQHLKGTTGKLWQTVAMVFSRFKYKIASLVLRVRCVNDIIIFLIYFFVF